MVKEEKSQKDLIKELQQKLEEKDSRLEEIQSELTEKRSIMEPEGGPGEWCQAFKWHGGETFKDRKGKAHLVEGQKISTCRSKYTQTYRLKSKKRIGENKPDLMDLELCENHAKTIFGQDFEEFRVDKNGKTPRGIEKEGILRKK